jgi:hypothetical protein
MTRTDVASEGSAGLGDDKAEPRLKKFQRLGEVARRTQPLPPALYNEFGRACLRRSGLDDSVNRCLMSVAKDREKGHSRSVVDRIISPDATGDMPAVEAEKLVEFVAGEVQRSVLCPIIRERQHRRTFPAHHYPSSVAAVTQCSRFHKLRPAV